MEKGVSKNRGTPKWMVKIMQNPSKMDALGVKPLFLGTSRKLGTSPPPPQKKKPTAATGCETNRRALSAPFLSLASGGVRVNDGWHAVKDVPNAQNTYGHREEVVL